MDGPPFTIREAFERELPKCSSENIGYRVISNPEDHERDQDPLRAFVLEGPDQLLEYASVVLNFGSRTRGHMRRRMPQHELCHYLRTESDVLRVSALQLIHPVNLALHCIIPKTAKLFCLSEVASQNGKARTDLKWIYSAGGTRTVVAVLEYKNTNVIRFKDFKPAITTPDKAAGAIERAMNRSNFTLLEDNAIDLSLQLQKYREDCEDVVIFDWFSMFIFDFSETNEDAECPILSRGIFSSNSVEFRSLLLGMIIRSLLRRNLIGKGPS